MTPPSTAGMNIVPIASNSRAQKPSGVSKATNGRVGEAEKLSEQVIPGESVEESYTKLREANGSYSGLSDFADDNDDPGDEESGATA